jgi:starch phosphorylase
LFGLTAPEVYQLRDEGYNPQDFYQTNPELKLALDRINSGFFSQGDMEIFKPLMESLLYHDPYFLMADYQSYVDTQDRVSQAYRNQDEWTKMSILNTARLGKFSSDRSIQDYCDEIWKVDPVEIKLTTNIEDML